MTTLQLRTACFSISMFGAICGIALGWYALAALPAGYVVALIWGRHDA